MVANILLKSDEITITQQIVCYCIQGKQESETPSLFKDGVPSVDANFIIVHQNML